MQSSYQQQVENTERSLATYKDAHFRGSFRVRLDCLTFEEDSFRRMMDDRRNVPRMQQILKIQGCLRLDSKYHVPVQISAADWEKLEARPVSGQVAELVVPLESSLIGLDHRDIIEAARKTLSKLNQWWIVKIFVLETAG